MARTNTGSTANYFTNSVGPFPSGSGVPFTISCWFLSKSASASQNLCVLFYDGNNYHNFSVNNTSNNQLTAGTASQSVGTEVDSDITGVSINRWHHGCGVWASNSSRQVFLNGNAGAANTTASTPLGADEMAVAGFPFGGSVYGPLNGSIAELAIWKRALSASDINLLAAGCSPITVHPDFLVMYCPMTGLNYTKEPDILGKYPLTMTGAMGVSLTEQWISGYWIPEQLLFTSPAVPVSLDISAVTASSVVGGETATLAIPTTADAIVDALAISGGFNTSYPAAFSFSALSASSVSGGKTSTLTISATADAAITASSVVGGETATLVIPSTADAIITASSVVGGKTVTLVIPATADAVVTASSVVGGETATLAIPVTADAVVDALAISGGFNTSYPAAFSFSALSVSTIAGGETSRLDVSIIASASDAVFGGLIASQPVFVSISAYGASAASGQETSELIVSEGATTSSATTGSFIASQPNIVSVAAASSSSATGNLVSETTILASSSFSDSVPGTASPSIVVDSSSVTAPANVGSSGIELSIDFSSVVSLGIIGNLSAGGARSLDIASSYALADSGGVSLEIDVSVSSSDANVLTGGILAELLVNTTSSTALVAPGGETSSIYVTEAAPFSDATSGGIFIGQPVSLNASASGSNAVAGGSGLTIYTSASSSFAGSLVGQGVASISPYVGALSAIATSGFVATELTALVGASWSTSLAAGIIASQETTISIVASWASAATGGIIASYPIAVNVSSSESLVAIGGEASTLSTTVSAITASATAASIETKLIANISSIGCSTVVGNSVAKLLVSIVSSSCSTDTGVTLSYVNVLTSSVISVASTGGFVGSYPIVVNVVASESFSLAAGFSGEVSFSSNALSASVSLGGSTFTLLIPSAAFEVLAAEGNSSRTVFVSVVSPAASIAVGGTLLESSVLLAGLFSESRTGVLLAVASTPSIFVDVESVGSLSLFGNTESSAVFLAGAIFIDSRVSTYSISAVTVAATLTPDIPSLICSWWANS